MNITLLTSEIAIICLSLLIIILDLLLPRFETRRSLGYLAAAGVAGVFAYTCTQYGVSATVYQGLFTLDSFALFFKQIFLLAILLTLLFSFDYVEGLAKYQGEFYALLLLAVAGMMIMASANDLLTVFIGTELMTVTFYILVGYQFNSSKSSEAGMKYMILGSVSSAVLLYGVSWVYGCTGSIVFEQIAKHANTSLGMLFGFGLIVAGLFFKMALIPFHMWAPEIYEGAPTPITAMLSMGSKVAGLAVLLRMVFIAFVPMQAYWGGIVSIIAAITMIGGTVIAMWQTNIKRMMAYSSITQAGYMIVGLLSADASGIKSVLFYAMLYMFANVGVFATIIAVKKHHGSNEIKDFSGLAQQSPLLAVVMTVSLLSMAGIPPMAGFAGKLYVFSTVIEKGYLWLGLLGFVMSMISVYYYLNVTKVIYMNEPCVQKEFIVSQPLRIAALISLLATLWIGIYPGPLAELANTAARSLSIL
ncbi:MAG: NADH-quinone oxidoreductase subunit N [Pelosinus sp.]|nr:NADH-quinone oxidoreductase subunit N [Pelosinus sp.]